MTSNTLNPAFAALVQVVTRVTNRRIRFAVGSWFAGDGYIEVPNNDAEGLLHELCHWAMAGPRRVMFNYGLTTTPADPFPLELREERMCGWVEDELYSRANKQRPPSSVDSKGVDYRLFPELRRIGLQRFRRYVPAEERGEIVNALQLDGSEVSTYEPIQ